MVYMIGCNKIEYGDDHLDSKDKVSKNILVVNVGVEPTAWKIISTIYCSE